MGVAAWRDKLIISINMEHISVNGEKYVKASSIARELGYTADYVGQLARSGKIDAQLVGRSWYVNERSIREHKRDRYRSTAAKSREALRESLASFTPSAERPAPNYEPAYQRRAIYNSFQYEPDTREVLPLIPERKVEEIPEPEEVVNIALEDSEEPVEALPEFEEVTVTHTEVHEIPIRAVRERESVRAKAVAPVRRIAKERENISRIEIPEERVVVVGQTGGPGTVLIGMLSLLVALLGFAALVGVEDQLVAEGGSLDSGYRFNLAAAVESVRFYLDK